MSLWRIRSACTVGVVVVANCACVSSLVSLLVPVGSTVVASAIGDPDGTRTVTSIVALLVAAGIALLVLARWLIRATRPDRELLAPLEVMGDRSWRRADPVWQRRLLHSVRPADAQPLVRGVEPPAIDASFDDGPSVSGFDDLLDDVPEIDITGIDDADDDVDEDVDDVDEDDAAVAEVVADVPVPDRPG